MFRGRLQNVYIQKDEGVQFSGVPTKQVAQQMHLSVNKKNPGILFPGSVIPASRPLHIYRKTGASHAITTFDVGTDHCTVSNVPWKMLGKNSYKYLNPSANCATCKPIYPNPAVLCQQCPVSTPGCTVPSVDCKAPYYFDRAQYNKKKCVVNGVTTSAYNVAKINNPTFRYSWGAVSSSNLALRKRYDAVITNNNSLFQEYHRRIKYSETPLSDIYKLTFKKSPFDCTNAILG
jgi:hypothetical protein